MSTSKPEGYPQALHVLYRDDFRNEEVFNSMLISHGIERPCEFDTLTIWGTVSEIT